MFWPDVAREANAAVERMVAAAAERRRRADQDAKWRKAVERGTDPELAAIHLGISRQRLRHLLDTVAA